MEADAEAGYEDLAEAEIRPGQTSNRRDEQSSDSSYVSEGQRGYVSVDNEGD